MNKLVVILSTFISQAAVSAAFLGPKIQEVSQKRAWKLLMHYEHDHGSSIIDNPEFFFSKEGKQNSALELYSAIEVFKKTKGEYSPAKLLPQCAFPERFKFVRENFSEINFPKVNCPQFESWRQSVLGKSVSMIFSTAYVDNPSSMFGHTFIKFNKYPTKAKHLNMLNYIAAFSAKVDTTDPGFLYAIKGVFGGYKGHVSLSPFYMKIREYSHTESRDLWDYKLKMNDEQQSRLVGHLWELYANANFDYYFIDENCTTLIARSLAVAYNDESLLNEDTAYVLPASYVRQLKRIGKVESVEVMPSGRRRLFSKLSKLTEEEIEIFDEITFKSSGVDKGNQQTLDAISQYYDYVRHQREGKVSSEFKKRELEVLSQMAKNSQSIVEYEVKDPINRPDESHEEQFFGVFSNSQKGFGLRAKFGFHDLLERDTGHEIYSQINVLDIRIERDLESEKWNNFTFDIADLKSLPDYSLYDPKLSWSIYVGINPLKELNLNDQYKSEVHVGGGISKRFLNEKLITSMLLNGYASYSDKRDEKFRYGPQLIFLSYYNILNSLKIGPRVEYRRPISDFSKDYFKVQLDISYNESVNDFWKLSLSTYTNEESEEFVQERIELLYGVYF